MEGKGEFKERWNCSLRKSEMYEPRKFREESVRRKGFMSSDAAGISKRAKHTGFGKKFGNLQE